MPTAISQETGQQSATANSYVTEAAYNTYLGDRHSTRSNPSSALALSYIYRAMSYFETLNFRGEKASEDQALQWPRQGVSIDGYGIESNEIPNEVLVAIYEIAYSYEQGYGIDNPVSRETISESVGGISVTYKSSSADRTLTPAATNALRKIVEPAKRVVRV